MKYLKASVCLRCLGSKRRVNGTIRSNLQGFPATRTYVTRVRLAEAKASTGGLRAEREQTPVQAEAQTSEPDTRSPLDRFRRPPKKPLSVTDLISPAWCELQYFYVLSKHGRKRRTPAMKQGSKVHQALEDEVHVTVPVKITTKEDSWGLHIWNVIQGLRTLRETGRTRELEIWGSVGGEFVNGVLDELSYDCPDPKLEEQSLNMMANQDSGPVPPEYQASIRDYLVSSETRERGQSIEEALGSQQPDISQQQRSQRRKVDKYIYITDVKTRGNSTLPTGSSIRPTIIQLHLYHSMLENLVQGNFALAQVAERYGLNIHDTFSDEFIAQIGGLNQQVFDLTSSQNREIDQDTDILSSTQDSMDILLSHNNLEKLWEFMMWQFRETFILPSAFGTSTAPDSMFGSKSQDVPSSTPQSVAQLPPMPTFPTRLSPLLTARYVSAHGRTSEDQAEVLGSKSMIFNPNFIKSYLYDALAFWRGERNPKGVELRDAWKCRICEFRDGCAWIHEQDELAMREAEERKKMREVAGLESGATGSRRSRV
ncbi:exonuclease V [Exophiala viscosa]|uniref:exonuclease V n=1 Tax=Exophiala viscosa TaxID=2486360 RepID=UPI0021A09EBE|nr:exonuclease V [Exophiala viscosa]